MTTKPTVQPHKSELRPLPMRITQLQFERLHEARGRDGLSVQEHIRRALDQYLQKVEREASRLAGLGEPPPPGTPPEENAPRVPDDVEVRHAVGFAQPGVSGPARPAPVRAAPRIRTK